MAANPDQFGLQLQEDDEGVDSSTIYRVEAQNGDSHGTTFISYTGVAEAGKGSFGVVRSADLIEGGTGIIAIKRTRQDSRYKNRELAIMKRTSADRHPNIVKLRFYYHEAVIEPTTGEELIYLNMVLEFYPETIFRTSRDYIKGKGRPLPELLIKIYTFQLLRGSGYLHSLGVCHRDIKPQNILVDPASGTLKIIDFGSAKILRAGEPSVAYTCSRFYRAPELIFGSPGTMHYTNAIDIWSIGCIMAELLVGRVAFAGNNSLDQLIEIIQVLGTPTEEQMTAMSPKRRNKPKLSVVEPQDLHERFPDSSNEAIDLLRCCWTYSPEDRIQAMEALAHCFFDELKSDDAVLLRMPNGRPLPKLFEWSIRELSVRPDLIRALVPKRERTGLLRREGIDVDRFVGVDLSEYVLDLD